MGDEWVAFAQPEDVLKIVHRGGLTSFAAFRADPPDYPPAAPLGCRISSP